MTPTCFGHNLTILREYKNSYNEVATIFFFQWCGGMRLYAYVMPVCSTDAPAVSGSNFIIGIFILPEDGQVMTETCRSDSKF